MLHKFNLKQINRFFILSLLAGTLLTACKKNEDQQPISTGNVIIANEGAFGKDNGAISFLDPKLGIIANNVYSASNSGATLGGSVNAISASADKLFSIIQTSSSANDKVEITDITNLKSIASVKGDATNKMYIPRNSVVVGNQLYVSNWGPYDASFNNPNSYVLVVDLTSFAVTKKMDVPNGADGLLYTNNEIYVAQSQGTTVQVISPSSNTITASITVPQGPKAMLTDKNGKIWVLCNGTYSSPQSKLVVINPVSKAVENTIDVSISGQKLNGFFAINPTKDKLYLLNSQSSPSNSYVYTFDIASNALSSSALISKSNVTGLGVDPNDGTIYLAISPNYTGNGTIVRFKADGTETDNFSAGIGPKGFVFK